MLTSQKHLFSLSDDVHYINCAYMSPTMKSVEEAGIRGIRRKQQPYSISANDFFSDVQRLRAVVGALVNAPAERMSLLPSVSYGMGIVAKNFRADAGKKIILLQDEFPSVVYACQRLAAEQNLRVETIAAPNEINERGKRWNERLLEAVDAQTAMVALSGIHWTDGILFDLAALRKRTRDVGALLVIDGTQFIGAMPFDIQALQPDALIVAAYKWMLGPYSTGAAYWGDYFSNGKPLEEAWVSRLESDNFSRLVDYQAQYHVGMTRFDVGEPANFILVPMFTAALEQLLAWGVENISAYCAALTKEFLHEVQGLGCTVEDETWRSRHLFGLRLPAGADVGRVQSLLAERRVFVSVRGAALRVAPNVYNNERDIAVLFDALKQSLS